MFRRKPRHRDQFKGELAEGIGHLRSATAHAASGARERMAPKVDNALVAAGLRRKRRRRWPWVAGTVVAVTAAAGTAGVIMYRRNNARALEAELFADEEQPMRDAERPADDLAYDQPVMEESTRPMAGASAD